MGEFCTFTLGARRTKNARCPGDDKTSARILDESAVGSEAAAVFTGGGPTSDAHQFKENHP
jgi:hypothetical protein